MTEYDLYKYHPRNGLGFDGHTRYYKNCMPLSYLKRIAQVPAPTFHEEQRSEFIAQLWRDLGHHPKQDALGNVMVQLLPENNNASKPALMLASHLDTVFPIETDVTVKEKNNKLTGPGIGDNSASLAVLTAFLRDFKTTPNLLKRPLWIAANICEEGLGDLRGAKALLAEYHHQLAAFVAIDGYLGVAVTQAVGVKRYKAIFSGPGGHSWGDQSPSAIHALGLAVSNLYALHRPLNPRTTLNVGTTMGGNSVNSIASNAEFLLDLRSLDSEILQHLDERAHSIMQEAARTAGVKLHLEQVGDRPGGDLLSQPLWKLAKDAAKDQQLNLRSASSSTDANAAVPYNLPAMSLGVYIGGNAHREDEWVQSSSLNTGLKYLKRFIEFYQHNPVA